MRQPFMRSLVRGCLLSGIAVMLLTACSSDSFVDDQKGQPLYQTDGTIFRFSDHRGQWILVNYWANWCASCLEEIPVFEAILKKRSDIQVIGVHADGLKGDALKQAVEEAHIHYPVLEGDPSPQLKLQNLSGIPVTVVIAPDGKITQTLLGAQTESSLMKATL